MSSEFTTGFTDYTCMMHESCTNVHQSDSQSHLMAAGKLPERNKLLGHILRQYCILAIYRSACESKDD